MKIFVYGGCVTRDLVPELKKHGHELQHYVARQSLPSATSGGVDWSPDLTGMSSNFQRRCLEGDLRGDLFEQLHEHADSIDVIFWDIMVERSGFHILDGGLITNSWELRHNKIDEQLPENHTFVPFGSDKHFSIWCDAINIWRDELENLGLLHKVIFFAPAFADHYRNGDSFDSKNYNHTRMTEDYQRYYDYIFKHFDFKVVQTSPSEVATAEDHQWGAEIYHYDKPTRQLLSSRALTYFGLCSLTPEEHDLYRSGYHAAIQNSADLGSPGSLIVDRFTQPIFSVKDTSTSRAVFFFNGALDPERANGRPVFQRSTWTADIRGSCIFLADPTLVEHPELKIGWGQGTNNTNFLPLMAGVIHGLVESFEWNEVVFYGSSAGGFQALMIASIIPFSVDTRVNNPQTDWLKYEVRSAVSSVIDHCFPNESQAGFRRRHEFWIAPMYIWEKSGRIPAFDYFVNEASTSDIRDHLAPLKRTLSSMVDNPTRENARIIHYFDPKAGHNPLDKDTTLRILNY